MGRFCGVINCSCRLIPEEPHRRGDRDEAGDDQGPHLRPHAPPAGPFEVDHAHGGHPVAGRVEERHGLHPLGHRADRGHEAGEHERREHHEEGENHRRLNRGAHRGERERDPDDGKRKERQDAAHHEVVPRERDPEPPPADGEDQKALKERDGDGRERLPHEDLPRVRRRHQHHVEGSFLALARDREAGQEHHLQHRERDDEPRHDVEARDVVLVVAVALAHGDGARAAVLGVEVRDHRIHVPRRDVRGRGVAGVDRDEDLAPGAVRFAFVEFFRDEDPYERVAIVHRPRPVLDRALGVEPRRERRRREDAVFRDGAHDAGRRGGVREVEDDGGDALQIEGRAVAEEDRLRHDRDDEDAAHAGWICRGTFSKRSCFTTAKL